MDYAALYRESDSDHHAAARVVYEGRRRRKKAKAGGIRVRKGAPGSKSLKRDLDRYDRDCMRSGSSKRFKGKRRKQYCAGVAWKRARKAGRHKGYFRGVKAAAKETTKMARKRRMPKRGPGGKFVKRSSPKRRRKRARAMAAETPRKVRRHRRRRRARAVEAPRRRRRRAHRAAPRRRRRRARAVEAPRRRRRRTHRAAPRRRRRSRARDPRGTHVYRRRPRIRRRRRRIAGRRRNVTLVSPRRRRRGHRARALANPLTGGELVVGGITGVLGYMAADSLDRYLATHALAASGVAAGQGGSLDTPAAGQVYNYQAVAAPMGIKRWGAGLGVAAVPILLAGFVRGPMTRSALQFFGIGALFKTLGKGATDLMVMLTGKTAYGMRTYADEISASNAAKQAAASGAAALPSIAPVSLSGVPAGRRVAGCCSNCAQGLPCTAARAPQADALINQRTTPPQANPVHAAGVPASVAQPPALPPNQQQRWTPPRKPANAGHTSFRSRRGAQAY